VSRAVVRSVQKAPVPGTVATTIVDAALGAWKLRRFMPAGPVDASLRKTFGLA
jgi:hypothetical protein